MSRVVLSLLLLLGLFSLASCAVQQPPAKSVTTALSSYYPQIKYQQINPTPVAGIYEIVVKNNEIVYFAPASGHMFFGELWSADAHNLTRDSKDRLMSAKLKNFPLDKALKIGNGPNQVVEIADPDCPFCRQGSEFFSARADVTRYVFLFPLDQLHPQSAAKARYILSAKDPEKAYEEVFGGQYDSQPLPAFKDNGLLDLQRKIARENGINGTPRYWINGQYVAGYNPQLFEKLLNKK